MPSVLGKGKKKTKPPKKIGRTVLKTARHDGLVPEEKKTGRYDEAYAVVARGHVKDFVAQVGDQTKAGEALGVDQGTISKITRGVRQASLYVLIPLREKLGLTLEQMLGLEPLPPGDPVVRAQLRRLTEEVEKMRNEQTDPQKKKRRHRRKPDA